jgi:hypothetical protein
MYNFLDHLKSIGFDFTNPIEGKINRCATTDSSKNKKPAWFIYSVRNGECFGAYGDFRNEGTFYYPTEIKSDNKKELISYISKDDQTDIITGIFNYQYNTIVGIQDHDYLKKKKVNLHSISGLIKSNEKHVVLPMKNIKNELVGLQKISQNGVKMFESGSRQKGSCFSFPSENKNRIIICEGWATGYSIWESTKENVCVAWSAGNIQFLAETLRRKNPSISILIAADNDDAGLKVAEECRATISNCLIISPKNKGEDFSDVFCNEGVEAVKAYFFKVSSLIQFGTCYREAKWFLDPFLESGAIFFIVGQPKHGKSFFVLYLALAAANNARVYHNEFSDGGGDVLYICGEDFNSVNIRVKALCDRYHWTDKNFMITTSPVHFLEKEEMSAFLNDLNALKMSGRNIKMIIVDTLNRNYGNGNENESADMTRFFNSCQKIFEVFPSVALGVVHHTGHGTTDRARGSSVITGSLNTEMLVNTKDGITYITCKEQKNALRFLPLSGEIKSHQFKFEDKELYSAVFEELPDNNISEKEVKSFRELRYNDN